MYDNEYNFNLCCCISLYILFSRESQVELAFGQKTQSKCNILYDRRKRIGV